MTASDVPQRLPMPKPFASKTGAEYTPIGDTTATTPNFEDGFPSNYSAPASGGGSYITRGQMNAIGRLASQNDFCDLCGVPNQFDADVAVKIGGYMAGAVLDYVEGVNFYKVKSLVDNNKVDYTGKTPTAAQTAAGITAGQVDGVNWLRLNAPEANSETILLADCDIGQIDTVSGPASITMNIASGVTPRTGALCITPTFGTLSKGSSDDFTLLLKLYYTEPEAEQHEVILLSLLSGASSAAATVKMKSGTLFSLLLSVGGLKFSSLKVKVSLI